MTAAVYIYAILGILFVLAPFSGRVTSASGYFGITFQSIVAGGGIISRTYGADKNLCVSLFLLTMFGPIYYGAP